MTPYTPNPSLHAQSQCRPQSQAHSWARSLSTALLLLLCIGPLSTSGLLAADTLTLASATSTQDSAIGQTTDSDGIQTHTLLLVSLLLLQTLLIARLLRSRSRHKRTRKHLRSDKQELNQQIIDRTNTLSATNDLLLNAITKHEITEELLQETQDYLSSIINSMPSVLIGVTRNGVITHWNSAAEHSSGHSAAIALGGKISDFYQPLPQLLTLNQIQQAIDKNSPQTRESIRLKSDDKTQYLDVSIYPLISSASPGAVIRIDDVTMRVTVENTMIQNEKMMSLGELAAGMAHEINNPLAAILNGVQNIIRRTSPQLPANRKLADKLQLDPQKMHDYLQQREIFNFIEGIREAGERATYIVKNMLEFSHSNNRRHELVNLVELLEHSLRLAHNTFELKSPASREQLHIERQYDSYLPNIYCCATEIQQVLINLLQNACQAFDTEGYTPPSQPTITLRLQREQQHLLIQVSDNGPGMSDDIRKHIFEPFFTTKQVGQGTGLGLSVSYFIITEHHRGSISLEPQAGPGSCFNIRLPLTTAEQTT